jgi:hypothetical protein
MSTHRALPITAFLFPLLLLTGCASAGTQHPDVPRDRISREMLAEAESLTAFQAVRRFRPMWLRSNRGQDSFTSQGRRGLRVYVDNVAAGGVRALHDLNSNVIQEMQFLDKRDATTRFGTDHAEGAILVTTRRGG